MIRSNRYNERIRVIMSPAFGLLFLAIAAEVAASATLPRTHGFREPVWSLVVIVGYAVSIWLLAVVVREIPVSTAYAIWAGLGTAAVAAIGIVWLGDEWDAVTLAAIAMIVVGVIVLNLRGVH